MRSLIADILVKAIKDLSPGDQVALSREMTRLESTVKDLGSRIGTGGKITKLLAGNLEMGYSDGLIVYNPDTGAMTVALEPDGDVIIGKNISVPADTSLIVFSNDQVYNEEDVGAGDVLMGDNSDDKANLIWDRSEGTLNLRYGETNSIVLGTDGVLTLTNSIKTTGDTVVLGNMRDEFGTGANDRYGIGIGDYAGGNYMSYNASVADGFLLKAGDGQVTIDEEGISLLCTTTDIEADTNCIRFKHNTVSQTIIRAYVSASANDLKIYNHSGTGLPSTIHITANSPSTTYPAKISLLANSVTAMGQIDISYEAIEMTLAGVAVGKFTSNFPTANDLWVYNDTRVAGGLYVGSTSTDPTTKCIHLASGGGYLGTTPANMSDDTAISFTPANTYGMLAIYRRYSSASSTQAYALALFRVADPVRMQLLLNGTSTEATTGALAGTTGTDGKFTISAHTDGKIYIENRLGAEISVHYLILGA